VSELDQVVREIEAEVRARRASGELPPDLERELDRTFAKYVPAAASGDDLDGLLAAAHRATFIDPDPPLGSRMPVARLLKTGEHKLLGWYFRFLAQQVTAFAAVVVQAVELLGSRVDELSERARAGDRLAAELRRLPDRPALEPALADPVVGQLAGAGGRLLVLDAGDGELLRRLADGGANAYGIDPSPERAARLASAGLDVRDDAPLLHLGAVAEGALGGIVLQGSVDRLPREAQLQLLDLAAGALAAGAPFALVGTDPAGWGRANPVEADLSPGRPFDVATWVHLLGQHGFDEVRTVDGAGRYVVLARRAQ
jgi:hypothetical protein